MQEGEKMNEKAKYLLSVVNSKAVAKADIALDTMTILTGINASGKSTLARILHQIVNLSAKYPELLERYAWTPVRNWASHIVQLEARIGGESLAMLSAQSSQMAVKKFEDEVGRGDFRGVLDRLDRYTQEVLNRCLSRMEEGDVKRAYMAFVRAVGVGDELALDVSKVYGVFADKRGKCLSTYERAIGNRQYGVYNFAEDMQYDIGWLMDADSVSLREDGELVYAVRRNTKGGVLDPFAPLKELFGVRHSFYIASPWVSVPQISSDGVLTIQYDGFPHFAATKASNDKENLFAALGGSLKLDEASGRRRWLYQRGTDPSVDLSDCATGIRSLAIICILYEYGYLTNETLLVIDEPEAHLHPQMIFDYARILVLIAKRIGVKMLLTSHNPDMISALKVVSEAERLDGVRFYLANEGAERYRYEYESLGTNIEKIFRKFNVALDRIDTYGVNEKLVRGEFNEIE